MKTRLILSRLGSGLLGILGAVSLVFILGRLTGDPAELMSPPGAPPEQVEQTRQQLGLDQPILAQYLDYLGNLLRGDFGDSYFWRTDAMSLVLDALPNTALLAMTAAAIAVIVGIPAGLYAAFRHNRASDKILTTGSMVGQSIPSFWLGPVLILMFAVNYQLFPASGMGGLRALVLPAVTLGGFQLAVLFRMTRATSLEVLSSDVVRLARSKGAGEIRLAFGHVLPAAALPILTVAGLALASLLGGSVIAETIFSWPGMGNLMIQAVERRDFPVVQAVTLLFAIIFVSLNTAVDILYLVIDPRLRSEAGA